MREEEKTSKKVVGYYVVIFWFDLDIPSFLVIIDI